MPELFTTLVVFDKPERGIFVKVTYPFYPTGMDRAALLSHILALTPMAKVILLPDEGIYDVGIKQIRRLFGTGAVNWRQQIANYEKEYNLDMEQHIANLARH